jgi:general secretion pathway protein B
MSYILEALKKAQAERQLGNAPTIHAPAPSYAAPRTGQGARGRYLALGVGAVVVAAAVALLWPRFANEQPVRLAAVTPPAAVLATAPATVPATAPVATPAPPTAVIPAPAPVIQPAPAPAPVAEIRPVRAKPAPAPVVPTASSSPQPSPQPSLQPSPQQREAVPAPATVAAQPVGDDQLRTLQQLPDTLQREIPKVAFGGYIYSPTPGESLLLVDKMLRREGEEVAPGLVLERLTPKAAVMNYRGTRYRAAY